MNPIDYPEDREPALRACTECLGTGVTLAAPAPLNELGRYIRCNACRGTGDDAGDKR